VPRPPSCACGVCATCRERERSRRRRDDPAFREEHRRRCQERYERLRSADLDALPTGRCSTRRRSGSARRASARTGRAPHLRAQDRRRRWLARCPGPGLTLDELAARSGQPRELLATVLAAELRRRRRRVWMDEEGRYRLVADRFDEETITALAALARPENERAPERARQAR
jgi:hypothetical protein